jgi:predicted DNA-binding protein (MmcQ/YjbR family)
MALPGTSEKEAWGHPNFRVAGHTFAVFEIYKGRASIAIRADPEEQSFLVNRFGFFKTPYVGNRGWVSVWVDQPAPFRLMGDLATQAHRRCVEAPRRTGASRRARKHSVRRRSSGTP